MKWKSFLSLIVSLPILASVDAAGIRDGLVCHLTFDGDGNSPGGRGVAGRDRVFEGEVHTSHPVAGRFDRYLPRAGTYGLRVKKEGYATRVVTVEVGREWKKVDVDLQQVR